MAYSEDHKIIAFDLYLAPWKLSGCPEDIAKEVLQPGDDPIFHDVATLQFDARNDRLLVKMAGAKEAVRYEAADEPDPEVDELDAYIPELRVQMGMDADGKLACIAIENPQNNIAGWSF